MDLFRGAARSRAQVLSLCLFAGMLGCACAQSPASSPALQSGISWLNSQVQNDGSLANESSSLATAFQSREESLVTLRLLTGVPGALALRVSANADSNVEYTARRVIASAANNESYAIDLASLLSQQNSDGGWGIAPGYQSDALDTAFTLQALHAANASSAAAAGGLAYLSQSTATDGGWGISSQSTGYVTASVLMAANAWNNLAPGATVALTATAWLLGARNSTQDFGTSFANAIAIQALSTQAGQGAALTSLTTALIAAQSPDGSWAQDPYVTALALRALWAASQPAPGKTSLTGKVIDGQTGHALGGVSVVLVGPQSYSLATDANGAFAFPDIAAGNYTLTLAASGFNTVTATIFAQVGQALDVGTVSLLSNVSGGATTGIVEGTVTDANTHQPIGGAAVTANGVTVASAVDGRYEIANLDAGQIVLSAGAPGYQNVAGTASLTAGGIVLFSPQLLPGSAGGNSAATLVGTVSNAQTNQPIAGATIQVTGASTAIAQTNAAGSYQISGLSPGVVQILVAVTGFDSVGVSTQLQINTELTFSPKLYPLGTSPPGANTAGVGGTVVDATTGAALVDVSVVATSPDGSAQTLATRADGTFAATGLTQQEIALSFSQNGYVPIQFSVPVVPLQTTDIGQIRLRPESANILLPDLTVAAVDSKTDGSSDAQTFALNGAVDAVINNIGTASTTNDFDVVAFYDVNQDGVFDSSTDLVLGRYRVSQPIAVDQSLSVSIPVNGTLPFRDAPVSVMADGEGEVIEVNETNNLGTSASSCGIAVHQGSAFTPRLKWAWSGSSVLPEYDQVMMAPVVARTHDDNGDGKIDENDSPDVIFVAYKRTSADFGDGILRIVRGKDGSDLVAVADPKYRLTSYANLAVGDINGDGNVEIVGPKMGGGLVAFAHDGTPLWTVSFAVVSGWDFGAPAIVDLKGDGHSVIIFGGHVVSSDGAILWSTTNHYIGGSHPNGSGGIALDLNNDGHVAVLFGASAFSSTGQLLWQNSTVGDGIDAVGRFNSSDPYPEIVVVGKGHVSLLDHQGHLIWNPVAIPGGGIGGAPIVADLDGDGIPEIGVAGRGDYAVFNPDGSLRWSSKTQDFSSACTSSTVFDFYNDGRKEIVYGDELYLRAYSGHDGTILWQIPNTTGTAYELPVLADIDGSGQASLLVVSNYYHGSTQPGATTGVRAFTDQNNSWADTRQIWNQLSYHIDNVNDDGTIPRHESASWLSHNSYRLNAKENPFGRADLTAGALKVVDSGTGNPLTLSALIGNGGPVPSGATSVAFYRGVPAHGGTLIASISIGAINPSQFLDIHWSGVIETSGSQDVYVVVDPDNLVQECDKTNNVDHVPFVASNILAQLSVATDALSYDADRLAQLTASATNSGSFVVTFSTVLRIEDQAGNVVIDFGSNLFGTVGPGAVATAAQDWNTGATLAGSYVLHGLLYAENGKLVSEARSMFAIVGQPDAAISILHTDKQAYNPSDQVQILSRVKSVSANAILNDLSLQVNVYNSSDALQYTHGYTIAQLLPGQNLDFSGIESLSNAPPGIYQVKQDLFDRDGNPFNHVEVAYNVSSTSDTGFGLVGTISATPKSLPFGGTLTLNASVTNHGNSAVNNLPLSITIVDPEAGTVLQQFNQTSTLAIAGTVPFDPTWVTHGAVGTTYYAVLSAAVGSGASARVLTLAVDTFELTLKLDASVALKATKPPLAALVLIDPDAGAGEIGQVSASLTALNYAATFVSTASDFAAGVRSGSYQVYLLFAAQVGPDETTLRLLREAVHRGEGVFLVNGVAGLPDALAQITGIAASTSLPIIDAQTIDVLNSAPGGAAHVALEPALPSRIVVPLLAQTQATVTGRMPSNPDHGALSDELAVVGRVDIGYFGSDAGTSDSRLSLASLGRIRNPDGSDEYTAWRIRNSGDGVRTVVLSSVANGYAPALTITGHTDAFVASPVVAGTADHRLVEATRTIQTVAALSSAFIDTRQVDVGDNPGAIALWANEISTTDVLDWTGSQHQVHGAVHSNSDIRLAGAQNLLDGPVHYVSRFTDSGNQNTYTFQPRPVDSQPLPTLLDLDDFKPGGSVAASAGYQFVDATDECANSHHGWQRNASQMPIASGVYWIPCDAHVSGGNGTTSNVTLVSTGTMQIDGAKGIFRPFYQGLQFATTSASAGALQLSGDATQIGGLVFAPNGTVQVSGSSLSLMCSVIGNEIRFANAKTTIDARQCVYAAIQRKAPAVLLNAFGDGWSAYAAFGWLGAIAKYEGGAPGELSSLFGGVLAEVAPTQNALRAGSVVPLTLSVQNINDPFTGKLALQANDDSIFVPPTISWALDFTQLSTFRTQSNVRLGLGSATDVTAAVSTATPIVVSPLAQSTATITHLPAESINDLIGAVAAISSPDAGLAAVLSDLQAAQIAAAANDRERALGHLLDAAEACGQSANAQTDALRTRIDWVIWATTH